MNTEGERMDKWTETHTQLQQLMKRERDTMRELLSNFHQEEQLILRKDKTYWNNLMQERALLIGQLSELRQERFIKTETLESMEAVSHPNPVFEELLPVNDENSWEILSLRDQILNLIDRMCLQSSRNDMLVKLQVYESQLQPIQPSKKKITLATLPEEDYKDRNAS
jgi:hypothetical protein